MNWYVGGSNGYYTRSETLPLGKGGKLTVDLNENLACTITATFAILNPVLGCNLNMHSTVSGYFVEIAAFSATTSSSLKIDSSISSSVDILSSKSYKAYSAMLLINY